MVPSLHEVFWTRERVVYHLKKSRFCLPLMREHLQPLVADRAARLDRQAASEQSANIRTGFQPRFASRPCLQADGLLPAWACPLAS